MKKQKSTSFEKTRSDKPLKNLIKKEGKIKTILALKRGHDLDAKRKQLPINVKCTNS